MMPEQVKTQKCAEHPEADAIHLNLASNAPLCVSCAVAIRREEAEAARHGAVKGGRSVVSKLYNLEMELGPGRHAAKVCFQVVASVIPGQIHMPEFTEEWWITGEQWDRITSDPGMTPDRPDNLFMRAQAEAYWYAERITDPRFVNWVRVEFIYF